MKKDNANLTLLILVLGSVSAIGPFSTDMYLPAFPQIAANLKTDIATVAYSLTSYFIGICVGQLVYGSLIDRYGRKKPLLTGLFLYMLTSVGCAVAPSVHGLIILRTCQALGACVGMVSGRAIVRDIFPASETAKVFSTLVLIIGVSPIVAPTVGGLIVSVFGWRYIFLTLASLALLLFTAVFCFLAESKIADRSISLRPTKVVRSYLDVIKDPEFCAYAIASGALSSGFFAYLAGSAFVYMRLFGLTERQYGWVFGANAVALIGGSQLNHFLLRKGSSLQISFITSVFQLAIGMLLIVSAATIDYSRPAMYVLIFVFLLTQGILTPNTTALALNRFRESAGTASAVIGFIQTLCGVLATGLVSLLHNGTALPMTAVMTGFSCLGVSSLVFRKIQDEKEWKAKS